MQVSQSSQRGGELGVVPESGEIDLFSCSYMDHRGRVCDVRFAPAQGRVVMGQAYCRRHATVAATLSPTENLTPDTDDRSMSLAGWVARDMDGPIQRLLGEIRAAEGGQVISGRVVGRYSSAGARRDRRWQRDWKLIDHTGIRVHVSLGVNRSAPDQVVVAVDGRELAALTPPWIRNRHAGQLERNLFYEMLYRNVKAGLSVRTSSALAS